MATKVGVSNNKQKSRRQAHNRAIGKYEKAKVTTEINRKRKQAKHQKMVEKKAAKKLSFSLCYYSLRLSLLKGGVVSPALGYEMSR